MHERTTQRLILRIVSVALTLSLGGCSTSREAPPRFEVKAADAAPNGHLTLSAAPSRCRHPRAWQATDLGTTGFTRRHCGPVTRVALLTGRNPHAT
jgi:hypothetical protein